MTQAGEHSHIAATSTQKRRPRILLQVIEVQMSVNITLAAPHQGVFLGIQEFRKHFSQKQAPSLRNLHLAESLKWQNSSTPPEVSKS